MSKLTGFFVKNGYGATYNHYRKLVYQLFLTLLVLLLTSRVQAKYSGGTGEPNNPYQIADANDLNEIGLHDEDWGAHFVMVNDVNLADYTGTQFNIIGSQTHPFSGVFDGNGFSIRNLSYQDTSADYVGLFAHVDDSFSVIKSLEMIDPNVRGCYNVGALVGFLRQGLLSNCGVQGGIIAGRNQVGGLVGLNSMGEIHNSYASGSINGSTAEIGGLVGLNGGLIQNCWSSGGWVKGSPSPNKYVGGLVGSNGRGGQVIASFAGNEVSGHSGIGGLIGGNGSSIVQNCYSVSTVDADEYAGGLIGTLYDSSVFWSYSCAEVRAGEFTGMFIGRSTQGNFLSCFWDADVNPDVNGIGDGNDPNVVGLLTAEMKKKSTFTDAGWDFVGEVINGTDDIWRMCVDGVDYPGLSWEFPLGDFVCPDGVDFVDFSFFASHWAEDNCGASNDCDGADLDLLGTVDINDLGIFVDNWLRGF